MRTIYHQKIKSSPQPRYLEYIFKKFWCLLLAIVQPVFMILLMALWYFSIEEYGFGYDINLLPTHVSNIRAWALFSTIIYVATSSLSCWMSATIVKTEAENKFKWNVWTLGLFSFLFIFVFVKDLYYRDGFQYICNYFRKKVIAYTDIKGWFKTIFYGLRWNNTSKLTSVYVFAFFVTLIGIIFIIFGPEIRGAKYTGIHRYFIFQFLSYFTELTNILCFVFVCFNLFLVNQSILHKHTLLIAISTYICIVSFGYWSSHALSWFEGELFLNFDHSNWFELMLTFWLHTVTPIVMLFVFIMTVRLSPQKPYHMTHAFVKFLIYPSYYAIYLYSMPFLVPFTVYGPISNTNPALIWSSWAGDNAGTPYALLTAPFITAAFVLAYYLHWYYANKHDYCLLCNKS